jgi:hypothetical protein
VLFDRHMNSTPLPLVITDAVTPTADLVERLARANPDEIIFRRAIAAVANQRSSGGVHAGLERAGWRCDLNGLFTATTIPAAATKCLPPSVQNWASAQSLVYGGMRAA